MARPCRNPTGFGKPSREQHGTAALVRSQSNRSPMCPLSPGLHSRCARGRTERSKTAHAGPREKARCSGHRQSVRPPPEARRLPQPLQPPDEAGLADVQRPQDVALQDQLPETADPRLSPDGTSVRCEPRRSSVSSPAVGFPGPMEGFSVAAVRSLATPGPRDSLLAHAHTDQTAPIGQGQLQALLSPRLRGFCLLPRHATPAKARRPRRRDAREGATPAKARRPRRAP
ncbi:hypothetical protein SAMN05421854_12027 [Amycolatopsis rubida]|uniref:Uncharacterized protein n=1 Tax=Amycolatopsis rubida TaxID=112413 RepID=A0A1I6ANH9_9PSEU|nr:hypothetical protein SAMN05421854_12027 [Amycolatopsis rubida]